MPSLSQKKSLAWGFFVGGGYFFPAKEGQNDKPELLNSFCVRLVLLKAPFLRGIRPLVWWRSPWESGGHTETSGEGDFHR